MERSVPIILGGLVALAGIVYIVYQLESPAKGPPAKRPPQGPPQGVNQNELDNTVEDNTVEENPQNYSGPVGTDSSQSTNQQQYTNQNTNPDDGR
jgi:hypothetical protein